MLVKGAAAALPLVVVVNYSSARRKQAAIFLHNSPCIYVLLNFLLLLLSTRITTLLPAPFSPCCLLSSCGQANERQLAIDYHRDGQRVDNEAYRSSYLVQNNYYGRGGQML